MASEQEPETCVVCRQPGLTFGDDMDAMEHHECGHTTHFACFDNPRYASAEEYSNCAVCRGEIDPTLPLIPVPEPRPATGRDYIMEALRQPVAQPVGQSIVSKILSPLIRTKIEVPKEVQLVARGPVHAPIDWMMRKPHNIGLQHMLMAGVTLDNFLSAGYTYKDLCIYHDIGRTAEDGTRVGVGTARAPPATEGERERARLAFAALGLRMGHFKLYGNALPYDEVQESLQMSPQHMVDLYQLGFHNEDEAISCDNYGAWKAKDLIKFGWKYHDLIGAGMKLIDQYEFLEATPQEAAQLGATPQKLAKLGRLPPLEDDEEPQRYVAHDISGQVEEEEEPQYMVTASRPQPQQQVRTVPTVKPYTGPIDSEPEPQRVFAHGLRKKK